MFSAITFSKTMVFVGYSDGEIFIWNLDVKSIFF